jgi:hypothetical protein
MIFRWAALRGFANTKFAPHLFAHFLHVFLIPKLGMEYVHHMELQELIEMFNMWILDPDSTVPKEFEEIVWHMRTSSEGLGLMQRFFDALCEDEPKILKQEQWITDTEQFENPMRCLEWTARMLVECTVMLRGSKDNVSVTIAAVGLEEDDQQQ